MTKLELRIAEVAIATGKIVSVGRQGHKDEWFAHCDGIESGGPSASAALEAVVSLLRDRADSTEATYRSQTQANERLRAL